MAVSSLSSAALTRDRVASTSTRRRVPSRSFLSLLPPPVSTLDGPALAEPPPALRLTEAALLALQPQRASVLAVAVPGRLYRSPAASVEAFAWHAHVPKGIGHSSWLVRSGGTRVLSSRQHLDLIRVARVVSRTLLFCKHANSVTNTSLGSSLESLISARTIEQLLGWERSPAEITAWVLRCGRTSEEMRGKAKYSLPVLMIINSTRKNKKLL